MAALKAVVSEKGCSIPGITPFLHLLPVSARHPAGVAWGIQFPLQGWLPQAVPRSAYIEDNFLLKKKKTTKKPCIVL